MKRSSAGFGLAVLLGVGSAWGFETAPSVPKAEVTAGRSGVSITAKDVPLEDLLRELSRVTGLSVYFEAGLDPRITRRPTTIAVTNTPLEEVLRRLLRDTSFIAGSGAADRVDEVKILASGAGPFTRLEAPASAPGSRGRVPAGRPAATPDGENTATLEAAALTHPDPAERASALARLGEVSDEGRAREVAMAALDREQHPDVLREALNILELQDELPRERLMRFVTASYPSESRVQALDLLADSGTNDAAFRRLVTALTRDQSESVRERAREILEDLDVNEEE
jgi:hypothetical protein